MEEELRKQGKLRGTPILLGNDEEWIISSLPLNDEGERIAGLLNKMSIEDDTSVDNAEAMTMYFDFMFSMIILNYPELTSAAARENSLFDIGMLADFVTAMTGAPPKA